MYSLWSVFAGAIATFIAITAVELLKSWWIDRKARKQLRLFVALELRSIVKLLEQMRDKHKEIFINYQHLNGLRRLIDNLEGLRKDSVLLSKDLQEDFINLLSELSKFQSDAYSLQSLKDDKDKELAKRADANVATERQFMEEFYKGNKDALLIDNSDLRRKSEDLRRRLNRA